MTHDCDGDEGSVLRDRLHAARCGMRIAYDRIDLLAAQAEAIMGEGRITMRPDLLIALSEAEQAARAAADEMKDAEYALAIALDTLAVPRPSTQVASYPAAT